MRSADDTAAWTAANTELLKGPPAPSILYLIDWSVSWQWAFKLKNFLLLRFKTEQFSNETVRVKNARSRMY